MGDGAAIDVTAHLWYPGRERSPTCTHDLGECEGCQPYLWLVIEAHGPEARRLIEALNERRELKVIAGERKG